MADEQHPLSHLLAPPPVPPREVALPLSALEIMRRHVDGLEDFHVIPDISQKHLDRITDRARLPSWEEVYAFVDATLFGTAKDFLAFATSGVFYDHGSASWSPRFQPWSRVFRHRVGVGEHVDPYTVRIGEALYSLVGSSIDHDGLAALIDELGGWAPQDATRSTETTGDALEAAFSASLAEATGDPTQLETIAEDYRDLERLYTGGELSDKQRRNARDRAKVPADETIIALLDCTIFRSAKDALVLTPTGVYHHNIADKDSPSFLRWPEIEKSVVEFIPPPTGPHLLIRGKSYRISADNAQLPTIVEMIQRMARHMCPAGTGPHDLRAVLPDPEEAVAPRVRPASTVEEFVESAYVFAHDFRGLELAPAIPVEVESRVRRLCGLAPGESVVAALQHQRNYENVFALTTAGVRYSHEQDAAAPQFQPWDQIRAFDVHQVEYTVEGTYGDAGSYKRIFVKAGTAEYAMHLSLARGDEVAALVQFLSHRAPVD